MADFNTYLDADGTERHFKTIDGAGSSVDPAVPAHGILDAAGGEVLGTTTTAAVTSDTNGSAIGFLRGLVKWAYERMPASLGQKAKSASLPVTLASDEDVVKAEDAAHTTGDKGIVALAVRNDTAPSNNTNADGDYSVLKVDYYGRLWANVDRLLGLTGTGQAAKANSLPVTLASDEDDINIATGATDDGAAAGQLFPAAGLYDDVATDEVDEGDVGRLRMSARRATLYASDYLLTEVDAADINSGYVVIDGVTFQSLQALKMGSEDGVTYGTTAGIVIPMATKRWKSLWLAIKNGATAHDQAIAVSVYISPQNDTALSNPRARVAQFTIPTTADLSVVVGEGTVGQGGNAGTATATNLALYALTVPRSTPYVQILLSGTLPTTGAFASIEIGRFS